MKYFQLKQLFYDELASSYSPDELESLFFLVVEEVVNMSRIAYFLEKEKTVSVIDLKKIEEILSHLKKNKPIQYIFNKAYFFGLPFFVNENVLIPRQETNELVDWVLNSVTNSESTILDIGTGSGCIAISLKKQLPKSKIFAIDISEKALEVAKKNADLHHVDIQFIQKNILKNDEFLGKIDIIVSNPPYVRFLEKKEMHANVLENEPHLALFVPDENPLLFYEKITEFASKNLSEKGMLFFEINQYLGKETVQIIENKGFKSVILRKDLQGNDRMLLANKS